MLENKIQPKIIKGLEKAGCYVVRVVHASKSGKHDLLVCAPTTITADMVGQTIGVFCSIDAKREKGGDEGELQRYNCSLVERAGGRAGFARSLDEALKICRL